MFLNGYPYTDFHEMNLDFLLKSMETLKQAFSAFTASNSLIFAEPLLHNITSTYAKNTIVLDPDGNAYISLQAVPAGVQLSNADYWLMVFNFEEYTEKANKNFTVNYFRDTTRAPYALAVGDWIVLDDILYTVTQAIAADGLFEVGTNLTHFTVEQFLKDFVSSVNQTLTNWYNQMTGTINQYKNDIDASELAYRNQLAQDIANTTASLQAQLDAAIAGVTVDSEVINARVGADGVTYPTLGDAIRTQFTNTNAKIDSLDHSNLFIVDLENTDNNKASDAIESMHYTPTGTALDISYLKTITLNSVLRVGTYFNVPTVIMQIIKDGSTTNIQLLNYDSGTKEFSYAFKNGATDVGTLVVKLTSTFDVTEDSGDWVFTPANTLNHISKLYIDRQIFLLQLSNAFDNVDNEFNEVSGTFDDLLSGQIFKIDNANTYSHKISDAVKNIRIVSNPDGSFDYEYFFDYVLNSILRIGTYLGQPTIVFNALINGISTNVSVTKYQSNTHSFVAAISNGVSNAGYIIFELQDSFDISNNSDQWVFTPAGTYNLINHMLVKRMMLMVDNRHLIDELTDGNPLGYDIMSLLPTTYDNALYGDIIVVNGKRYMYTGPSTRYQEIISSDIDYDEEVFYDACILGGGNAGTAAAYALKGKGFKTILVEANEHLGGTPCVGGVSTWIPGYNTPIIEDIFTTLEAAGDAVGTYADSWMPSHFSGQTASSLDFIPEAMSAKIENDLVDDDLTILTNSHFVNYCEVVAGTVWSVIVRTPDKTLKINARFFIDSLTDADLVRSINNKRNVDYLYGRDYPSMFNETLCTITSGYKNYLNEPSWFFRIEDNYDDSALLAEITTVYRSGNTVVKPAYITSQGYPYNILGVYYINPMTGNGYEGIVKLVTKPHEFTENMRQRTLEYWKYIKLSCQIAYEAGQTMFDNWPVNIRNYGFVEFMPMIGNRETFRIYCEEMLTQNDLSVLATNSADVIAVGTHNIDFHVYTGLNAPAVNSFNQNNLRPYAIKYGSLIPLKLKNVMVASKCFGASQLANASARVAKVVNQLGFAAGNAIRYALENDLTDVRDVNVNTIKGSGYMDFNSRFTTWMSHYNN